MTPEDEKRIREALDGSFVPVSDRQATSMFERKFVAISAGAAAEIESLISTNPLFQAVHVMRLREGWSEVRYLQELAMAIYRHDRMLAEEIKRQMIERCDREPRVTREFDA